MLLDVRGWDLASVQDVLSLFFLLKKIEFAPWPDIMLIIYYWLEIFLLTLTSDSEAIPLHCLWAKLNNRTRGQFEYDVTLVFLFLLDFVHSHARCGCCSIVCLRFQVMPIKQVDCKMSTKKNFFQKRFRDFLEVVQECTNKNLKPRKSR